MGLVNDRQHIADMGLVSHKKDVFQIQTLGLDRSGVGTRGDEQSVKGQGCAILDHYLFLMPHQIPIHAFPVRK